MTEEWKAIAGYEGFYEVSNLGCVRSVDRVVEHAHGRRRCEGKVLFLRTNKLGYLQINLSKDGKYRTHLVHRLVAIAFIANPDGLPMVNHIDGVKSNNAAVNLEWADDFANKAHAIRVGTITKYKKLLSAAEVDEIRSLAGTMTQAEIAKRFGTTQTNISLILTGKHHKRSAMVGVNH